MLSGWTTMRAGRSATAMAAALALLAGPASAQEASPAPQQKAFVKQQQKEEKQQRRDQERQRKAERKQVRADAEAEKKKAEADAEAERKKAKVDAKAQRRRAEAEADAKKRAERAERRKNRNAPPAAAPAPAREPPKPAEPEAPGPEAETGLNPNQRLARAVDLLNRNDRKAALAELNAVLAQTPTRREALVLKRSVEGNPYELLPRGSFSYIVAPGDTFVTLARDYLGDSYKFFALARISQIVPDALKPGDAIQIPGRLREPKRPGVARPRPARPRPAARPRGVAGAPAAAPAAPQADPATALRLRRQGLEQMTAGRINSAVDRLNRAQQLDPDNRAIAADLARARRIQGAVRTRQ